MLPWPEGVADLLPLEGSAAAHGGREEVPQDLSSAKLLDLQPGLLLIRPRLLLSRSQGGGGGLACRWGIST